ncbi:MAG: hypothetical protein P4L46_13775 [Fimbriimonas sp.]|nr:hypothetical protein [Fimbriimonas sp.]
MRFNKLGKRSYANVAYDSVMRAMVRVAVACLVAGGASLCFAQKLSRVSLTANSITGSTSSSGTIELSDKAGKSAVVVELSSSSPIVTIPNSVTVAVGQSSVPFSITSVTVAADTTVVIKATVGSVTTSINLVVQSPRLTEFAFNPNGVQGGSKSTGTVKVNAPAPTGGLKVNLASNTPYWGGPTSVMIAAGSTSGSFVVTTLPVVGITSADVTASIPGSRIVGSISITAARFQSFTVDHSSVVGGSSAIGTITLDGPAPKEGFHVKVTCDSSLAKVPAFVVVPAGQSSITFTIATKPVKEATTARIATGGTGGMVEIPLSIVPPIAGSTGGHGN